MAKFTSSLSKQAGALMNWVDDRLPVTKFWNATMTGYMAPKNFNFWYYMGFIGPAGSGDPDFFRHSAGDALQAVSR